MKKSLSLLLIVSLILIFFFGLTNYVFAPEEAAPGADITVSLLVPDSFGDKSFADSAKSGIEKLKTDYGIKTNYIECKGENYKQAMSDTSKVSDYVVCVGWEFWEIESVCNENFGTNYIWVDNEATQINSNLISLTYAQNEGSYLVGYVAGKMTETGNVGFVGYKDNDTINDFLVGFKQGVKKANVDVSVYAEYGEGMDDPDTGKALTEKLFNEHGVDIVFQAAGGMGEGVFKACKELGIRAIGVDEDQRISYPEYADVIICSMEKKVGDSIYNVIKTGIDDGFFDGGAVNKGSLADSLVGVAYGDKKQTSPVSEDIKMDIQGLTEQIISGEIDVNTTMEKEEI